MLEQLIADNLPKGDKDNIMRTIADTYIEEGINKGIAIGESRLMEVVRRMLKENADIKFISSVTGLSIDDILKIQNKL